MARVKAIFLGTKTRRTLFFSHNTPEGHNIIGDAFHVVLDAIRFENSLQIIDLFFEVEPDQWK